MTFSYGTHIILRQTDRQHESIRKVFLTEFPKSFQPFNNIFSKINTFFILLFLMLNAVHTVVFDARTNFLEYLREKTKFLRRKVLHFKGKRKKF